MGPLVAKTLRLCAPVGGARQTTFLSDTLWMVRADGGGGGLTVLRRSEAEALQPQSGEGLDGFDARRFGPSGRKQWMFDSGYSDRAEAAEYGRRRLRSTSGVYTTD